MALSVEEFLEHAYDPVAAREYYLRNRQLKGRQKAAVRPTSTRPVRAVETAAQKSAKQAAKKASNDRLKKIAEKRVADLKGRLAKLEAALKELTAQAKARSGADTKSKETSNSPDKNSKPLTAAQKNANAKRAKEYREKKDGDPSLSAEAKQLEAKIEKVRERIAKMKTQLAEAKSKANTKDGRRTAVNTTEERR